MTTIKDITNKHDVKTFVNAFYDEVRNDNVIGPIFNDKIPNERWPMHLERMYSFWNTVLFGEADYRGNPFSKHSQLPIADEHFDRWLVLLESTLDKNFKGAKTEEVKERANKMSLMFRSKLAYIKSNNYKSIM